MASSLFSKRCPQPEQLDQFRSPRSSSRGKVFPEGLTDGQRPVETAGRQRAGPMSPIQQEAMDQESGLTPVIAPGPEGRERKGEREKEGSNFRATP